MAKPKPLVSVIMPYYKGDRFIRESVDSILQQTFADFELIVVDDCSPDKPASEILKEFNQDPRINIIRHESNQGLANTRNTAYHNSKGEFILPIDCDDLLKPTFLERCVEEIQNRLDEIDAVFTQIEIFGAHEEVWAPDCTMINIMAGNPVTSTILYKRNVFESVNGYRKNFKKSVDSDFWIRALHNGCRVTRIDEPLFLYRKHDSSISNEDQLTEVTDLAEVNEELYKDNLVEVLKTFEARYNKLKHEYLILEEGFRKYESGYDELLTRYNDVVARLQERSVRYQINKLLGSKDLK